MPRKGWPLAPAFGGCGLDRAWRSAEVCHQEIDGEVWPRCNFKPLVFSQFRTAVDTEIAQHVAFAASIPELPHDYERLLMALDGAAILADVPVVDAEVPQ